MLHWNEQPKAGRGCLLPQQALIPPLSFAGTEITTPKWRGQGQKQPQKRSKEATGVPGKCANSPGHSSRCPAGARAPALPSSSSPGTPALARRVQKQGTQEKPPSSHIHLPQELLGTARTVQSCETVRKSREPRGADGGQIKLPGAGAEARR